MRFATRLPGLILPLLLATFLAAASLPAHAQNVADIEAAWRGGAAKGATGRPVGLLLQYLMSTAQAPAASKPDTQPQAADKTKPKVVAKPLNKAKSKARAASKD